MYETYQSISSCRAKRPHVMDAMTSSPSSGPSCHRPTESQQHNPYARMPSRRAIACITCAKAKTKCNKALPSCSRCITKGIKCQPRSTRRTSDNNNRPNVKKPSRSPRRHYATNTVSCIDLHTSSTSLPPSQEPGTTHLTSYLDAESTAKSRCEDLVLSGYPMLTPLRSQGPQSSNDFYPCVEGSEYDPNVFTQPVDANHHLNLGAISPQTPGPAILYEPVSVLNDPGCYLYHDSWSTKVHMSDEVSVTSVLPEIWATSESTTMVPTAQVAWPLSDISDLPRLKLDEPASLLARMASSDQYQLSNQLDPIRPEWTFYGPSVTEMDLFTSAQFMYDLNLGISCVPIWEVPSMP